MSDFERGSDNLATNNQAKEIASCKGETCSKLGNLQVEVNGIDPLPKPVTDYLSANVSNEVRPLALEKLLAMQQNNPNIFLLPPNILPMVIDPVIESSEIAARNERIENKTNENAELDEKIAKGNTTVEVLSDEVKLEKLANTDPDLKDLGGRLLLNALLRHVYVRERSHLIPYLEGIKNQLNAISNLASTPEEAAALDGILNSSTLYLGADNFTDVFADVLAKADSSPEISEATKVKIHQLFKIPTIRTAGDIQDILDAGYGTDENGDKIPITQGNKARVFPNTYLYEMPSGDRIFEVNLEDGRNLKVRFDGETNTKTLFDLVFTTQTIFEMEKLNLAKPIWQRGWNISHGGMIDLHYDDIITAKRIGGMFLGGMAGQNARLLSQDQQGQMAHSFQAFPKKGQAAEGDNNVDHPLADYKELTIVNEDGTINWTQFEKAASYLQDVSRRGGEPNFEDLKKYLQRGSTSSGSVNGK